MGGFDGGSCAGWWVVVLRSSVKISMEKKMTSRIAMSRASALLRSVLWTPYGVSSDALLVFLEGSLSISVTRCFGHTTDGKEAGLDNNDNDRKCFTSLTYFGFASCVVSLHGNLQRMRIEGFSLVQHVELFYPSESMSLVLQNSSRYFSCSVYVFASPE